MNKILKVLLSIVAIAILLAGAVLAYKFLSENYAPPTGTDENLSANSAGNSNPDNSSESVTAPNFTVYDADGNTVSFDEMKDGKPIVINFWASWCGPCKNEMPDFQAVYDEYGDKVNFMIINMTDGSRETVETAHAFIEKSGYSFPVYYDKDMSGSAAYNVTGIPTTVIVSKDGYVFSHELGMISGDSFKSTLDDLLSE
ncbi:MAG: redoxin domain-containing protein [Oscillospiraceae bacterium]